VKFLENWKKTLNGYINTWMWRLDRATASESFLNMFSATSVQHIAMEESDHMALLIRVQEEEVVRMRHGPRGFRFEEMWTRHGESMMLWYNLLGICTTMKQMMLLACGAV
jgi:hypothetical protein